MPASSIDDHEKAAVRAVVFHHLSGIVLAPTVKALHDRNVFELFADPSRWVELDQIVERTHGNRGYLRVALRLLVSCGWLKQRTSENAHGSAYALTPEGMIGASVAPRASRTFSLVAAKSRPGFLRNSYPKTLGADWHLP